MNRLASVAISALLAAGCAAGSQASGKPLEPPLPSGEIEVSGVVELGVESGCRVLRTDTELYQLISADPGIRAGARLTVRGRPRPDMMTTCQQGIPLQVTEVRPA